MTLRHAKLRHCSSASAMMIARKFKASAYSGERAGMPFLNRMCRRRSRASRLLQWSCGPWGEAHQRPSPGPLALQLVAIAKMLQRLGIGQRLEVLDGVAVDDVAHRELDDLPALGARDVGHLHNFCRHVPRRRVLAYLLLDPVGKRIV